MSKLAQKIVTQLAEKHGVKWPGGPENADLRRTYAGRHEKACGAWAFFLYPVDEKTTGYPAIGSQWPASVVAKGFTTWDDGNFSLHLDPTEEHMKAHTQKIRDQFLPWQEKKKRGLL